MAGSSRMPGNKAEDVAQTASHAAGEAKDRAKEAASGLAQRAGEVASNLTQKASDVASSVKERAQDLASGAAERTEHAKGALGQGMSHLAGSLRENAPHEGMMGTAAGAVADRLEAGGRYLQESSFGDMGEDVIRLVRQYPVASLLTVFGVGYMLGSAMRR